MASKKKTTTTTAATTAKKAPTKKTTAKALPSEVPGAPAETTRLAALLARCRR